MTRAELPEEEPQIAQISQIVLCKNINTRGHPERSSAAATWGRTQLKDPVEPPATSMPFLFTSLAADFRGQRRPKRVEGPRSGIMGAGDGRAPRGITSDINSVLFTSLAGDEFRQASIDIHSHL
jgi:hypothetical protein